MPWIPGYIPKRNYQNAIFDAIDRYLTRHPGIFQAIGASTTSEHEPAEVFVDPPSLQPATKVIPPRLERLIRSSIP